MSQPQGANLQYDTAKLVAIVPNLKTSQSWLSDSFFTNIQNSDTEYVAIDVDVGERRMAPLVSPMVQGRLVEQRRMQTNTIKPAYTKDKRAPDLRKPVRRQLGERIGGDLDPMERQEANLVAEMTDQLDILHRRLEWMASQILQSGSVTLAGDGFPTTLVDFGRSSTLTIALSGSSQWGTPSNFDPEGRDPLPQKDIEEWQYQILKESGAVCTDIVFTTASWVAFKNGQGIYGAIAFPKLAGVEGLMIKPGPEIKKGAVFKGVWGGYRLWLYNDWYIDQNGVEQQMIPDGTVILTGPELMGTRGFGVIMDPAFNYGSMPFAPKTWLQEDPGQRLIMMQSSPLMIPARVNASLCATVCAGLTT